MPKAPYQFPLISQKLAAVGSSRCKLALLGRSALPAQSSIFVCPQSNGKRCLFLEGESVAYSVNWFSLEPSSALGRLKLKLGLLFFFSKSSPGHIIGHHIAGVGNCAGVVAGVNKAALTDLCGVIGRPSILSTQWLTRLEQGTFSFAKITPGQLSSFGGERVVCGRLDSLAIGAFVVSLVGIAAGGRSTTSSWCARCCAAGVLVHCPTWSF